MKTKLLLPIASSVFFAAASAQAVVYTNDFSTTGLDNQNTVTLPATGNATTNGTRWSLNSGTDQNTYTVGATDQNIQSYTNSQLANTKADSVNGTITFSSTFSIAALDTPRANNNQSSNLGLTAFGTTSNAASSVTGFTGGTFLLTNFNPAISSGTNSSTLYALSLTSIVAGANANATTITGGTSGLVDFNGAAAGTGTLSLNTNYSFRLVATYASPTTFGLNFGVFDTNGNQLGTSATATYTFVDEPTGGWFYGYRSRSVPGDTVQTPDYRFDDFNVAAVPEPSTYAMFFGAIGFFFVLNKSRRKTL